MNAQVISLQSAVVLRGQRAWSRIKTTAAEQRQLWREVGEALLELRAQYPSNQAFGARCVEHGFDDIKARYRSAAQWLATNWEVARTISPTISDPKEIQAQCRDLQASKPPAPELDLSAPADPSLARIAAVMPVAAKVRKLAAHAQGTGPEAETARRYLKKGAEAKGLTVDEMVDTAQRLDAAKGVSQANLPGLEHNLACVTTMATELADFLRKTQGRITITREVALAVVLAQFELFGV